MGKIVIETVFDSTAGKVWDAITNPETMKTWYFDIADFKPVVGTQFSFYEGEAKKYFHQGEILKVEEHKILQHTWTHPEQSKGTSTVTWEIDETTDGKVNVTLTHEGVESFGDAGVDFSAANFEMGWNAIVKTSLRNFLYGIKKLTFDIEINASAAHIWNIMWDKNGYTEWTTPFCEGSYFTGEVGLGNRIHFLAPNGEGMFSDVFYIKPNKIVMFKHIGIVKDGKELPMDAETEKWTGCFETYKFNEVDGKTALTAEVDCVPDHIDFMNKVFPLALQELKKLSENN